MALRVNIVVHQLEQPRWEVVNWRDADARFIQLSYHTGDHYASVQPINGAAGPTPYLRSSASSTAALSTAASTSSFAASALASAQTSNSDMLDTISQLHYVDDDANWQEHLVMKAADCSLEEARHALLDNFQDTDAAINFVLTLKLSAFDDEKPRAVNSRQKLTESGGVLSIPTPDDLLVASLATASSSYARNTSPPLVEDGSSTSSTASTTVSRDSASSSTTTAASTTAATTTSAAAPSAAAVKAAAAAVAAGWQTQRNKKEKKQSKRTAEELRLKAQSKAPQQHISNRERRQIKSANTADDNSASAAEAVVQEMTPEMIERLAGIEPEPTLRPIVDLGSLAI